MTWQPAHRWEKTTFGRLARIGNGADYSSIEVEEGGYPVYGSGGEFRRASSYLYDGASVLFGRKGTVDRPLYVEGKFWTVDTMFYSVIDRSRLLPRFAYYWATTLPFGAWATDTALPSMTSTAIKAAPIALPPVSEQRAIVEYLDRETAQIDAFIAKNEELITLLTERRAAVIAHAVTRGIDAGASLQASEVEWLGEVPSHWSVQRLASTVARARNGVWGADPEGGEDDLRCVRVADFDRPMQRIHDDAHTLRKLTPSERAGRTLRNGDLLLEKSGGGEKSPVGFVVLYDRDEPAVCSNFVARVELREGMDPKFWTYVHGAMYRLRITEKSLKQSTGIQNLDQRAYFNEYVAVPPYREQCAIAEDIEQRTADIDAAVGAARHSVALARERRAALISAAVTGKIDVGVAA
ncbi:hypothetical protein GCM10027058_15300 [Microbacterium neimengense]